MIRVLWTLLALVLCGPLQARPLLIAVISDLNGSYGTIGYGRPVLDAVAMIIAKKPDLVIVSGDMVAGQRRSPKLTTAELQQMWAGFERDVAGPLRAASIPVVAVAGNHDASAYPGYQAERSAFKAASASWKPELPFLDDREWPFVFATKIDDVLVIGLDVTVPGLPAPPQLDWLRDMLARQKGKNRAILVVGHLPYAAITQGREGDIIGDPAFQDVLQTGDVTAYLSGHHHAFAVTTRGDVRHIAQGALGSGPRKRIGETTRAPQSFTWLVISDTGDIEASEIRP